MSNTVPFHAIVDYVDALSEEDQDLLIDLVRKRRVEKRRAEIAQNAARTLESVRKGTAKRGSVADLMAKVLDEDE